MPAPETDGPGSPTPAPEDDDLDLVPQGSDALSLLTAAWDDDDDDDDEAGNWADDLFATGWERRPAWWREERAPGRAEPVPSASEGPWRQVLFGLLATRPLHPDDVDLISHATAHNLLLAAGYPLKPPEPEASDLAGLRRLRDALVVAVLDREAGRDALNQLVDEFALQPGLPDEIGPGELPEPWLFSPQPTSIAALAEPLCSLVFRWHLSGLVARVGVCAEPRCGVPFLDGGRRGDRRYCGTRCSARARQARARLTG